MLNKRANIMFDENVWNTLALYAKKKKTTVGVLVRDAVEKTYSVSDKQKRMIRAHRNIVKLRTVGKSLDYKALIEEGRKW